MHASIVEAAAGRDLASWDWRASAACQGRTALFFAPPAERPAARQRREATARSLCLACPVLWTCRQWARDHREYGYWGAESEEERALAGYCVDMPIGRVASARRTWRSQDTGTTGAAPHRGGPVRVEVGG